MAFVVGLRKLAVLLSGFLAVLLCTSGNSARAKEPNFGWLMRTWQTDDGLPDNRVYSVAQSPDALLWVATPGGLVRFDGLRFEELRPVTTAQVPRRGVTAVYFDQRGRMWLGYKHGEVVCVEGAAVRRYGTKQKLPVRQVDEFAEGSDGTLVAAYASGKELLRIKDGHIQFTHFKDGPCHIAREQRGVVWIATGESVGVLIDGQFHERARMGAPVLEIAPARAGGVWVATARRLLKVEEGRSPEEKTQLPDDTEASATTILLEDRKGGVWIGTRDNGLWLFDGRQCEKVETVDRVIRCLGEDEEGNIWVGTSWGLNQLRPRSIGLLTASDGVSLKSALSIAEQIPKEREEDGRLWVVTEDGKVLRQEGASWSAISTEGPWRWMEATCVAADLEGGMWIAARGPRLHQFADGKLRSWSPSDGLAGSIRTLFVSSRNDLWVAVTGPDVLQRMRSGILETFPMAASMPQRIRAIAEDKSGRIWVGTAGGRLLTVEGDRLVFGTGGAGERFGSIRCLEATADGSLWIGCGGWGLARLKDGQLSRITTAEGLNDDYISQMIMDASNRLWFIGARGLFEARMNDLAAVAEGRTKSLRSVVYGRGEGVRSLQAVDRGAPQALRRRSGELCFPTLSGVVMVDPKAIQNDPAPSRVSFDSVTVDGQLVGLYDASSPWIPSRTNLVELRKADALVSLRPNYRKLEIRFRAVNFASPENVQYRYQLEGFDNEWVEAGSQRSATYPNVPAGDYRFSVTARNELGTWNEEMATLLVRVTPFFWQTAWFRWGMPIGFSLGLVGMVRFVAYRRLRQRVRDAERTSALEQERVRIARDMHDTLGASLTQIIFLGAAANRESMPLEQVLDHVARITRSSQTLVQQLDEIVWAVDPENDTLDGLVTYTSQFATEFFADGPIRCRVRAPALLPEFRLTNQVRHTLFLAVREALNNIARHSKAKEATIGFALEGPAVLIEVEDDGCGFDVEAATRRHGQTNIKRRLEEIGGVCQVQSRPGAGTRITLRWLRQDT